MGADGKKLPGKTVLLFPFIFTLVLLAWFWKARQAEIRYSMGTLSLVLWRPHYEGYHWSFYDGLTSDPVTGKMRPLVFEPNAAQPTNIHFGFRWIPSYWHNSLAYWIALQGGTLTNNSAPPFIITNNSHLR